MLGRLHMTVEEAIKAYLDLAQNVFAPKHKFNKVASLFNTLKVKGLCDSEALETAIKARVAEQLGEDQEDALLLETEPTCHVCVCALRGEKRSLIRFRNYPLEGKTDLRPKIWEAARATSAATLFFDPITIGRFGQTFVDGAGGFNNPVEAVYEEAVARWKANPGNISLVISIGTGKNDLKDWGKNLNQLRKTLADIVTETDKTAARFARNRPELNHSPQRLFRFQVAQGLESVKLDEHKKIKEIASATQIYMEEDDCDGAKQLQAFKKLLDGASE
ncbi:calcium-independent phospholipase A2-gamma [Staphylotrichum tortipilum]|uniref:Calcium-independent phospholipase A2-gamma n=1 Tax=Staphylotrichum tortipilum TaxID=2831512 RepID=A0AAN6MAH5_9PEZI|nr:calcium-independent phospholipase A2-gamma [Staphylotrichum longicolle]